MTDQITDESSIDDVDAGAVELLPVAAVAGVLESISRRGHTWGRDWPLRRRLIAFIGSHPYGVRMTNEQLALELECSRGGLVRALRDLHRRQVLIDLEKASGRRPTWRGVSRAIERWDVPWRRPLKHVRCDAFHGGSHEPIEDDDAVAARGNGLPARDTPRSRALETDSSARLDEPKKVVARANGVSARDYGSLVARQKAFQRATTQVSDGFLSAAVRSTNGEAGDLLEGEKGFDLLKAKVARLLGFKLLYRNSPYLTELVAAVTVYGCDALLEAAASAPTDLPRIAVIDWLRQECAAPGTAIAPTLPVPDPELFVDDEDELEVRHLRLLEPEPDVEPMSREEFAAARKARREGSDVTPVGDTGSQLDRAEGDEP